MATATWTALPRSTRSTSRLRKQMMLGNGRRRSRASSERPRGAFRLVQGIGGVLVRPGDYEIRLRAFDRAGNRSVRTRAVAVRVRYVELVLERVEAVAGRRFAIGVATDAEHVPLAFDGRRGHRKPVLVLRAPDEPGTYVLYVVGRWADRAGKSPSPSRPSPEPVRQADNPAADRDHAAVQREVVRARS